MIFRKANGDLIIIEKLKYKPEKLFYEKIMELTNEYTNNIHINNPKSSNKLNELS